MTPRPERRSTSTPSPRIPPPEYRDHDGHGQCRTPETAQRLRRAQALARLAELGESGAFDGSQDKTAYRCRPSELARSLPIGRLISMSSTTIKVDTTIRDRLATLAHERGTTMGNLLADVVDHLERDAFFAQARTQLERLRDEDPDEWARYRDESRIWQQGTDDDALALQDEPGWWE